MNWVTIAIVALVASISTMINDAVAQHEEETGVRITEEGKMIINGEEIVEPIPRSSAILSDLYVDYYDEDEGRRVPAFVGASKVNPYEVKPYLHDIGISLYSIGGSEVKSSFYDAEGKINFSGGQWAVFLKLADITERGPERWTCAGSLVSPEVYKEALEGFKVKWNANNSSARWVITAAHCLIGPMQLEYLQTHYSRAQRGEYEIEYAEPAGIKATTGTLDKQDEQKGEVRNVIAVMVHENFDPVVSSAQNDIALLLLDKATKPLPMIKRGSIQLADKSRDGMWINKAYLGLTVQGWGLTSQIMGIDKETNVLMEVQIPLVDDATCDSAYSKHYSVNPLPGMICAGFSSGGAGSCKGDSGGPLLIKPSKEPGTLKIKEPVLIGVVSGGNKAACVREDAYNFYTSVIDFRSWLDQKVKECDVNSPAGCS